MPLTITSCLLRLLLILYDDLVLVTIEVRNRFFLLLTVFFLLQTSAGRFCYILISLIEVVKSSRPVFSNNNVCLPPLLFRSKACN
jgi:hypothetical protein